MLNQEMVEIDEKTTLISDLNCSSDGSSLTNYECYDEDRHNIHLKYLENLSSVDRKKSWWFHFCLKLRQKELGPGWEPSFWQNICPYPFCPTYRYIARIISLFLVGLLVWGVMYCIIGEDAAPRGQLFDIALLCIGAHFGGVIFKIMNLPGLVGMLMVGIVSQNIGIVNVHREYAHFTSILRKIALVIILTRAGLDLNPDDMKKLIFTVLRLGVVPWFVESAFAVLFGYYLLQLPWMWAILMGSIIGAVSPAVVVPCLFRLRTKGYGVAKGIPTLVIAVAGIDDAISVAAFGIVYSIMFSKHSLMYNILLGPFSVISGVGFGIIWSLLSKYIPEKGDPFAVPLRILMLLCGGLITVFGSDKLGLSGAAPLGVVAAAFGSSWIWHIQGWNVEDNPVASVFAIFWMLFEPILFSLTGTQIKIVEIDPNIFTISIIGLLTGIIIRILTTVIVGIKTSLNLKEKLCCALSWMGKASVQAALGPIVVDTVQNYSINRPEKHYAGVILMICVLSIVLTAPACAVVISFLGPRLLKKTVPGPPSEWRKSLRPSLRDITIVENNEETDNKNEVHY